MSHGSGTGRKGELNHDHPGLHCYKKWGAEGCGEPHDHDACREMVVAWQRENRRHRRTPEGQAKAEARRRHGPLDEDELMKLRRAVGLI